VRTGAEVAPAAQGGDGDADNVGDFGDGEQLVVGVRVLRRCDLLGVTCCEMVLMLSLLASAPTGFDCRRCWSLLFSKSGT